MNKRVAITIYLGAWLLIVSVGSYALMRTDLSFGQSILIMWAVFTVVNGSLAYRHHARILAQQGRPPPAFASFLLFGSGGNRSIRISRWIRVPLGLLIAMGGVLFATIAFVMGRQLPSFDSGRLLGAVSALSLLALLAALFIFVAWRLVFARDGEHLFGVFGHRRGSRRNGA